MIIHKTAAEALNLVQNCNDVQVLCASYTATYRRGRPATVFYNIVCYGSIIFFILTCQCNNILIRGAVLLHFARESQTSEHGHKQQ